MLFAPAASVTVVDQLPFVTVAVPSAVVLPLS